jgi:hypothetical protein
MTILYLIPNHPYTSVVHLFTVHTHYISPILHAENLVQVFIKPPAPRPRRTRLSAMSNGDSRLLTIDNKTSQLRQHLHCHRGHSLILFAFDPARYVVLSLGSFRVREDRLSAAPFRAIYTVAKIRWRREVKFFQVRKLDQDCQNVLRDVFILVKS